MNNPRRTTRDEIARDAILVLLDRYYRLQSDDITMAGTRKKEGRA